MSKILSDSVLERLSSKEVQQYILEHELVDEKQLVLKQRTLFGIASSLIADQIKGRRKAKSKLPTYYKTSCIVYPPSLNMEQCSSETTALFKCDIAQRILGKKLQVVADLTGGFGIDSFYLSKSCRALHYVEPDKGLLSVAKHNHSVLNAKNIFYFNTAAETFMEKTSDEYDLIFIDPSRRTDAQKKVFKFKDCEPDISMLLDLLLSKSKLLIIKASPLIDIQQGLSELKKVNSVYVVSVENDCKEILFVCSHTVTSQLSITTNNFSGGNTQTFSFSLEQEKNTIPTYADPQTYLYEPNASILKAGAFKLIGSSFQLSKIHSNTHLYTSEILHNEFPGRIFKVLAQVKLERKSLKSYFLNGQGNVITRNYPLTADDLRKKAGLKDGGENYLIGFSGEKKKFVLVASRLK